MNIGSEILIENINLKFISVENTTSQNYSSQVGVFDAYEDNKYIVTFLPEKRTYNIQKNIMTEAAIDSNLRRDIYVAIGENLSADSWVVRIYYKPFMQLLWYGVTLMILGGLFGIFSRENLTSNTKNEI